MLNRVPLTIIRLNIPLIPRPITKAIITSVPNRLAHKMSKVDYKFDPKAIEARKAAHPIHPIILSRTSPRGMTGEETAASDLQAIFEAGRWAFSFYNQQPARFVYARRGTDHWQKFFDLLWPLNQRWCDTASVLVVAISKKHWTYEGKEQVMPTYSFDVGAACQTMGLEASARGFVFHCMAGVHYDKVYEVFGISKDTHNVECMIAIGKRDLSKEERVSDRNPIEQFVFEGDLNNNLK